MRRPELPGCRVEKGFLLIGRVDIGSRCFIGIHSALGLDVRMEDDTRLDDQSLLPDGAIMQAHERRRGAPPQAGEVTVPQGNPRRSRPSRRSRCSRWQHSRCHISARSFSQHLQSACCWFGNMFSSTIIVLALLANALTVPFAIAFFCIWVALLKALILRRTSPVCMISIRSIICGIGWHTD